ncbi:hypothetical protein BC835DRAFT_153284 [Cytidiella melzeri]|nr:hypothetical protein BC835DRAFT_153284 [Cytidiella melzeri]
MDVFSYMEKAYKAMKLIKDTLDDLKDAPDNLQLLRLRASSIEELLNRLDQLPPCSSSGAADADLQCLAVIAAKRLEEVEGFLAKMRTTGENGKVKLKKARFLQSKVFGDNIEDLSTKLDNLQTTLRSMCEIVTIRSISQITTASSRSEVLLQEVVTILGADSTTGSAHIVRLSTPAHRPLKPPSRNRLRCVQGCACRCHRPSSTQVVPSYVTLLVGHVYVPKRRPCDVQTCRQDQTVPSQAIWYLPSWMFKVEAQVFSPFYLSIHTARFVRNDAPIWQLIIRADIDGLRELFLSGEASVHDVNEDGRTVLYYARDAWLRSRKSNSGQVKASCDMIEFLADAGADPDFSIGQL